MTEGYCIFWTSANRDTVIDLGTFDSRDEAEAAIPEAWASLRAQIGKGESDEWLTQGTMEVVKENRAEGGDE